MTLTRLATLTLCLSIAGLGVGCSGEIVDDQGGTQEALTHAANLASEMPSHLVLMDTMAWFGIPKSNPDGAGPDPSWGNWDVGAQGSCVAARNPATCDSTGRKAVSSRFHPLVGIYSSSGLDAEGLAHMKLMLSNLRSDCDPSARIDAFAMQLNGTHWTSLHGLESGAAQISYEALEHMLTEADAEKRQNAVLASDDASWYWNNGHYVGLECSLSHATCIAYLQQDVEDMLKILEPHASALRIGGKLVLHFYVDSGSGFPTVSEWETIFANARAATGLDFYAIGSHAPASYFAAFDGLAPWVDPSGWPNTSGATVYDHALAYAKQIHASFLSAVPAGKVVFGGLAPGFDDFTEDWGQCKQREMPQPSEAPPRDLDVLRGTIDYFKTAGIKGMVVSTWDDYTEGSLMEPTVEEGATKLVTMRQELADLYGEAQDAAGDAALTARWEDYGVTYPCPGGLGSYNPPAQCEAAPPPPPPTECSAPKISIPTIGESVGPSIDLTVSAPSCIGSMIAYIDSEAAVTVHTNSISQWVPVSMGAHKLNVNAWTPSGQLYESTSVTFTRTY